MTTIPAPTHTVTVAVGDRDATTLASMVREVAAALTATVAPVAATIERHYGNGTWEDEPEYSAHVTAYPVWYGDIQRDALRRSLADIARRHGQDAIAVWAAPADLVQP